MGFCACFVLASIFVTGFCFLSVPLKEENKYEDITVELITKSRYRRSTEHKELDLNFNVNGSNVKLHLKQNGDIRTDVPTLILRDGSLKSFNVKDVKRSTFFQDTTSGAVFMMQKDKKDHIQMVGMISLGDSEYLLQSNEDLDPTNIGHRNVKFKIHKERLQDMLYSDFEVTETGRDHVPLKTNSNRRHKRAAGSYIVELFIVVDFSIFEYWYDKSTAATIQEKENEAIESIRQFYAFVINGVDAMYKNIQTTDYTMTVVFAGITIAQKPSDAPWTETIKVTSVSPFQVDSSAALTNFKNWVQGMSGFLPEHDHAMLFTKYDLTSSGSTSNAGLAYLSAVCTDISQSIVEDHFSFVMLTVAAHELGHSLSAGHDGEGNACSFSDSYIMAASTGPQQNSATATNPWKFSSCSTNYFTSYINSLESASSNCMSVLSPSYNSSALSEYAGQEPGQVYDADAQCRNIHGPGSFFCKDRYYGDFTGICTVLWCAVPGNTTYCRTSKAADGTHCGNNKWCKTGVCTYDVNAPPGVDSCLYGDFNGQVFSNQPWNCTDVAAIAPNNCPLVPDKCCHSCAPYLPSTTTSGPQTTQTTTAWTGSSTSAPTTTPAPTQPVQLTAADEQCQTQKGNGSVLCRSLYSGDFSTICSTMWCSNPDVSGQCLSVTVADGTLCGNQKWCLSGVCTFDANAPTGVENCLYGDRIGAFFTNGWTCADMVANAPNNCPTFAIDCCASCAPYLTTTTMSTIPVETTADSTFVVTPPGGSGATSNSPNHVMDIDQECESQIGPGSFMCRSIYAGEFSPICATMWCSNATNPSSCLGATAPDGTPCGDQEWCIGGACVYDVNAPPADEKCLFGDKKGAVFTNGWTCSDMIMNGPHNCPLVPVACCHSCVPYLTTPPTPTTTSFDSNGMYSSSSEFVSSSYVTTSSISPGPFHSSTSTIVLSSISFAPSSSITENISSSAFIDHTNSFLMQASSTGFISAYSYTGQSSSLLSQLPSSVPMTSHYQPSSSTPISSLTSMSMSFYTSIQTSESSSHYTFQPSSSMHLSSSISSPDPSSFYTVQQSSFIMPSSLLIASSFTNQQSLSSMTVSFSILPSSLMSEFSHPSSVTVESFSSIMPTSSVFIGPSHSSVTDQPSSLTMTVSSSLSDFSSSFSSSVVTTQLTQFHSTPSASPTSTISTLHEISTSGMKTLLSSPMTSTASVPLTSLTSSIASQTTTPLIAPTSSVISQPMSSDAPQSSAPLSSSITQQKITSAFTSKTIPVTSSITSAFSSQTTKVTSSMTSTITSQTTPLTSSMTSAFTSQTTPVTTFMMSRTTPGTPSMSSADASQSTSVTTSMTSVSTSQTTPTTSSITSAITSQTTTPVPTSTTTTANLVPLLNFDSGASSLCGFCQVFLTIGVFMTLYIIK